MIELTPTEYKLLLTLAERRGRVQARAHLLETVWEAAPDIQTRTVDMHVQRLRTKLGERRRPRRDRSRLWLSAEERSVAQRVTLAKRLLVGLLVLVILLVAGVVAIAGSRLRDRLAQETRRELEREARLVASKWRPGSIRRLARQRRGRGARASRHADRFERRRRRRFGVRRRGSQTSAKPRDAPGSDRGQATRASAGRCGRAHRPATTRCISR